MGENLSDSTPRWEVFVDEFLAEAPKEQAPLNKRTTSIAEPIHYMRRINPRRAREMQRRRDDLVGDRESSAIDPNVLSFTIGANTVHIPRPEPTPVSKERLRAARRLVAIARDSVNGWPELAKTNPELAAEPQAEHQAAAGPRERAANDPSLLSMELD